MMLLRSSAMKVHPTKELEPVIIPRKTTLSKWHLVRLSVVVVPEVVPIKAISVEVKRQSDMVIVLGTVVKIDPLVNVPTTFSIVTSFKREVEKRNPTMLLLRMRIEGSLPKVLTIVCVTPWAD